MNDCCKDRENLYQLENDPDAVKDETIDRCKVCGGRHFTFTVDAGSLGLKGNPIT